MVRTTLWIDHQVHLVPHVNEVRANDEIRAIQVRANKIFRKLKRRGWRKHAVRQAHRLAAARAAATERPHQSVKGLRELRVHQLHQKVSSDSPTPIGSPMELR